MPELTMQIELAAASERVWTVLTDFAAYPTWNPYQTIDGKAAHLAVVTMSLRGLDGRAFPKARVGIWKFEPNARLEFVNGLPLWYSSKRFFHLSPSARGTVLRHGIRFSGIRAAWQFSHGHDITRLQPIYEAIERALVRRLDDRPSPQPLQNNRRSRRASKAKDR